MQIYIYIYIYISIGYHKECIDCCSKVIYQYENYNIEISYHLYFDFLFYNYINIAFPLEKASCKNENVYIIDSKNSKQLNNDVMSCLKN